MDRASDEVNPGRVERRLDDAAVERESDSPPGAGGTEREGVQGAAGVERQGLRSGGAVDRESPGGDVGVEREALEPTADDRAEAESRDW